MLNYKKKNNCKCVNKEKRIEKEEHGKIEVENLNFSKKVTEKRKMYE